MDGQRENQLVMLTGSIESVISWNFVTMVLKEVKLQQ